MKNMSVFEEYENEKKKDIEIGLKVKNISFTGKKDFMKIPKRKSFSKKTSINLINPLMPKNKIFLQECTTKVSYRKTKDLHFKNPATACSSIPRLARTRAACASTPPSPKA